MQVAGAPSRSEIVRQAEPGHYCNIAFTLLILGRCPFQDRERDGLFTTVEAVRHDGHIMMSAIFVLHSPLSASAAVSALRSAVDEEHRTLFSLSSYKGEKPVLGRIESSQFRVQRRRRYSRNDFAGHFYGRIEAESSGTRIEGYFDLPRWVRWYMRIWITGAILVGVPLFVQTFWKIGSGKTRLADDWVGIVAPPLLIGFGLALPKVGRLLGERDRQFLLEYVQHTLRAQPEQPMDFT